MKSCELTGPALDWAIIIALGTTTLGEEPGTPMWKEFLIMRGCGDPFVEASTSWDVCGPIIERERIALWHGPTGWYATPTTATGYTGEDYYIDVTEDDGVFGPTPLVAAMRCFVASKLGAEVDVPEGLL